MVMDQQLEEAIMTEPTNQVGLNQMKKGSQHIQERTRSERLKKDANLTTMEKVEREAQKKNLEGNPSMSNSFSVLSVDDIVHISSEIGIVIENDNFDTCNLLNDLETTRNDLYLKQLAQNVTPQTDPVEEQPDDNKILELVWLQDESSESKDFILVESRRKKDRTKSLSNSLLIMGKRNKVKKILAHKKER